MFSCKLMVVLIPFLAVVTPGNAEGLCVHDYQEEPSSELLNGCNPNCTTVHIACSVSGPDSSYTILWHWVPVAESINQSSITSLNTIISTNKSTRYTVELSEDRSWSYKFSKLIITNFQQEDFGYFWCTVRNEELHVDYPNPTRIILVTSPCNHSAEQCSSPLDLWESLNRSRCANVYTGEAEIPSIPECSEDGDSNDVIPQPTPASAQLPPTEILTQVSVSLTPSPPSDTEEKSSVIIIAAVAVSVIALLCLMGLFIIILLIILYKRRTSGKKNKAAILRSPSPSPDISAPVVAFVSSVEGEYVDVDVEGASPTPYSVVNVNTESCNLQPRAASCTTKKEYQSLSPTSMDYISIYATTSKGAPKVVDGEREYCIIDKSKIDPPSHYE